MSLLSRLFGNKYNDEQIRLHAQNAIAEDPLVNNSSAVAIGSAKGIVRISGTVQRIQERDRIEGVIRDAIRAVGLKYDRIINELKVG